MAYEVSRPGKGVGPRFPMPGPPTKGFGVIRGAAQSFGGFFDGENRGAVASVVFFSTENKLKQRPLAAPKQCSGTLGGFA